MTQRRSVLGWYFFDWASQPFHTLLITFLFAPYLKELLGDGAHAQGIWGLTIGIAGVLIAVTSPWLGALADRAGRRMWFVAGFSVLYMLGSWGLWYSVPGAFSLPFLMLSFILGMIGVEFATVFTNSMLPDVAPKGQLGRVSGSGWAFGYLGGLVALIFALVALADSADTGKTLIGIAPLFGLDPSLREGIRAVGPFTALWFGLFMIPFFLWVRLPKVENKMTVAHALRRAGPELRLSLRALPQQRSLMAFLGSSMLYRDALNGFYAFGGLYAAGVLDWSITSIGIFGIVTLITGAAFAWIGGRADDLFGPRRIIAGAIVALTFAAVGVLMISRDHVFGILVDESSSLPDIAFYLAGGVIGAAGGTLQAASRTMLVHQARPEAITEAFGLYALAGKATAFLAPLSIGAITMITDSQPLGMIPLMVLFLLSLILLAFVKPKREEAR
ncbi:MFS transporter [Albirhodobacter sp. R86504]|uniref:MFS transporter n=1 Tax=Albirhodobacter sp. R86504 TaxID=3093848 RepID=UPI0036700104